MIIIGPWGPRLRARERWPVVLISLSRYIDPSAAWFCFCCADGCSVVQEFVA